MSSTDTPQSNGATNETPSEAPTTPLAEGVNAPQTQAQAQPTPQGSQTQQESQAQKDPQAQQGSQVPRSPTKLRPRTGPIVWGALILAFCLFVAQRTVAPGAVDPVTWLITGVVGLGALLLAVGIAVLLRGSGRG